MQNKLKCQEKCLKLSTIVQKKQDKISEYLSKKTKQLPEMLMMNNIDSFRMKREVKILIDQKQDIQTKLGNMYWLTVYSGQWTYEEQIISHLFILPF
jgi:hypothetical protein